MSAASDGTPTWGDLLAEAETRFAAAGSDSAPIDARRIVEEAVGVEGAELTLRRAEPVTERQMAAFDRMVSRRLAGEPLQYVLGRWGFRKLDLAVDGRVLIPRPETEVLVDVALGHVDRLAAAGQAPVTVVDLGTGSGAIALSIAAERVRTSVWATDRSADALAVARANLAGLGRAATRVQLREGSWFGALPEDLTGTVGVIVSNPPYVTDDDPLPTEVEAWEPTAALRAGPDGLDDLTTLVEGAAEWLVPGGGFVVELDPRQATVVSARLSGLGFTEVTIVDDLTGRARVVSGRWG